MSLSFKPCVSRTACTEDGTHCRSCGRSHEEIAATRNLVSDITDFLLAMEYENFDDFLDYLKKKVAKKINRRKSTNSK